MKGIEVNEIDDTSTLQLYHPLVTRLRDSLFFKTTLKPIQTLSLPQTTFKSLEQPCCYRYPSEKKTMIQLWKKLFEIHPRFILFSKVTRTDESKTSTVPS